MTAALVDPQPDAEWLGLGRAARMLGVHPITLRRWADQGEIPVMLTAGGHRRFALANLEAFAARRKQLRLTSGLEQSWAAQALQHTRREIGEGGEKPWLAAFGEPDRQQNRELGRRLMGVMLQYVSLGEGGEDLLAEAAAIGAAYAENGQRLGLSLVDTLQAMLFFRDTLVEAAVQLPDGARARPEANLRLVRRINGLLNTVQLAIAGIYQQAKP